MERGIQPGNISRTVVRAYVPGGAVRLNVVHYRRRALAQLKQRQRVVGQALLDNLGLVLVELHALIRPSDIDSVDSKAAAQYPLLAGMVGHPYTGLEVLEIPPIQTPGRVDHCAHDPGQRIDSGGTELTLLSVGGVVRAFRGPAKAQVERQVARKLPVILEIDAVDR